VSRNGHIREVIAGWERAVREHEDKLEIERAKPAPNSARIAHWEGEIRSFKKQIDRLLRRLRREW
jgi:hypothetical protein